MFPCNRPCFFFSFFLRLVVVVVAVVVVVVVVVVLLLLLLLLPVVSMMTSVLYVILFSNTILKLTLQSIQRLAFEEHVLQCLQRVNRLIQSVKK